MYAAAAAPTLKPEKANPTPECTDWEHATCVYPKVRAQPSPSLADHVSGLPAESVVSSVGRALLAVTDVRLACTARLPRWFIESTNKDTEMKSATRRVFMIQVVATGAVALAGARAHAQAKLDETDPQAAALGYTINTNKVDKKKYPKHEASQLCGACAFYQGKAADSWGGCGLFGGKQVSSKGWCSAWAKKA